MVPFKPKNRGDAKRPDFNIFQLSICLGPNLQREGRAKDFLFYPQRSLLMLRVNIGLSRKITRDYQSTGYSINLDGELGISQGDPKAILDEIDRLYRLAEDALDREIDRDQGEQANGRRDEIPPSQNNGNGRQQDQNHASGNGRGQNGQDESASNKQIQFLLSIGKRQGLSKQQVEARIEEILGQRIDVYRLTKRQASRVIDALNQQEAPTNGRR